MSIFDYSAAPNLHSEYEEYIPERELTESPRKSLDISVMSRAYSKNLKRLVVHADGVPKMRRSADVGLVKDFNQRLQALDEKFGATGFFRDVTTSIEYMEIVGMGPDVLPLLLADLRDHGRPWFYALRLISRKPIGDDLPVGDLRGRAKAWLEWGSKNNIL